jgi:hypothetical protein
VKPTSIRRRLVCSALALAVTGCAFFDTTPPPGPCPRTAILADASSLVRFRDGPGRDLIDVSYVGRLASVTAECKYNLDKKTKTGTMTVTATVAMGVERGPANRDRRADFEYFVTLADAQRQPLEKSVFKVTARFPDNITRLVLTDDPIELKIPLKAGQTGRDFIVFVGYQLTEADLEYNRDRRRELSE